MTRSSRSVGRASAATGAGHRSLPQPGQAGRHSVARAVVERPRHYGSATTEIAEPTAVFGGLPYQFFDLIAVGPFQPIGGGPFRPNRIMRPASRPSSSPRLARSGATRLPAGNPSAAEVMAGQQLRGPRPDSQRQRRRERAGSGTGGRHVRSGLPRLPRAAHPSVPAPPDGSPRLLDITLTIDVRSVAVGSAAVRRLRVGVAAVRHRTALRFPVHPRGGRAGRGTRPRSRAFVRDIPVPC